MAPKSETLPSGILRLTKLLSQMNAPPKLKLPGVKALRLSLASKNDHFGARHFLKSELPRIRYANPELQIQVQQAEMTKASQWRPVMELDLEDGTVHQFDLQDKWSTTILKELMEVAGGDPWKRHVAASQLAGLPAIPSEHIHEKEELKLRQRRAKEAKKAVTLPTLQEYLKANPPKVAKKDGESKQKNDKQAKKAPPTPPTPQATETLTEATS